MGQGSVHGNLGTKATVGGGTQFVHGRSRVTLDPRIPTMPGRSTSGLHQPGRHCLHQARSAMRCSTSRTKGELHLSKNRSEYGLRHLVPTFLFFVIPDSANELYVVFWCDHSRDRNGYYYMYLPPGCLTIFTLRDAILRGRGITTRRPSSGWLLTY